MDIWTISFVKSWHKRAEVVSRGGSSVIKSQKLFCRHTLCTKYYRSTWIFTTCNNWRYHSKVKSTKKSKRNKIMGKVTTIWYFYMYHLANTEIPARTGLIVQFQQQRECVCNKTDKSSISLWVLSHVCFCLSHHLFWSFVCPCLYCEWSVMF